MRFVINRESFAAAVGQASRAVSNRSTLPILSNVLIEAGDGGVTLSATDLEIGVRATTAAFVELDGRTTVNARLLAEVLGAMPAGQSVQVETDEDDHVVFQAGKTRLEINGLPADEFPVIPAVDGMTVALPQGTLKQALGEVVTAVSADETRARLTGVYCVTEDGRLRLVATDTHRLCTVTIALPDGVPDMGLKVIVPARTVREIQRLLSDGDGTVEVRFSESQLEVDFGALRLVSRLIEGEFPNYKRVLPAEPPIVLRAEVAPLRESVRRCAIVAREDNRKVYLKYDGQRDALHLSAVSTKLGRAEDSIDLTGSDGDEIEVAFNADYLLDAINGGNGELALGLTAYNQPGLFTRDGDDWQYVLMPMHMV